MGEKWHKKRQGLKGSESHQSLFQLGGLVCVRVRENTVWSFRASELSLAQENFLF